MKNFSFLTAFFLSNLFFLPVIAAEEVCLTVKTLDTEHEYYKNKAYPADYNRAQTVDVFNDEVSCFIVGEKYWMSYFLRVQGRGIWYGTKCRYEVKAEDHGKYIWYKGDSGGYPCPITENDLEEPPFPTPKN